ncbi:MAG: hypothetical protein ACFFDN_24995 [Candidatus Hodarchaeota archaeon]
MKNTKTKIQILVILILFFSVTIVLSSFITSVRAGPTIPVEPHPENSWHWGVDEGDIIMFEVESIITNFTSKEIITKYRNIFIWNISSIENVTGTFDSLWSTQEFSELNVTWLWENPVGVLENSGMTMPIGYFGFHPLETMKEKYHGGHSFLPTIFPINDTIIDISLMADIANESYFDPLYQAGRLNKFDSYSVDIGQTKILFENASDGYYIDASYYANNGTIKDFDAYYLAMMGPGPDYLTTMNTTGKRVFEYNTTDEIDWSFDIGDSIYYHLNSTFGGYQYVKIDIDSFNKEVYWSRNWTYPNETPVPMTFDTVYVNISNWNGTDYEVMNTGLPISAANNFYPICFPLMEMVGGGSGLMFFPYTATLEDFKFVVNNETHRLLGNPDWFPFDINTYQEAGEITIMEMEQLGGGKAVSEYNHTTGLIETQYQLYNGSINTLVQRVRYFPEWPVDIGDIIYMKQNMNNMEMESRVTITKFYGYLVNMSEVAEMFSAGGILFTLPPGQPELQFFMEVYGQFDYWDYNAETWVIGPENFLSASNEYWPIAPYTFAMAQPIIMPKGTVATDLQQLLDIIGASFDYRDYSTGHITMRDTSANKEMHFYFDGAEGKTLYMRGWNYMMDQWIYMSVYPEIARALTNGPNSFTLQSYFTIDTSISIDINTNASGADCIYTVLPYNPIAYPLPKGEELLYLDLKITDTSLIDGNITMTFMLPSTIDLITANIYFWAWNVSGLSQWEEPPPEFVKVTYNYNTNSITFEYPIPSPYAMISAISYDMGLPPEIPGYDLYLISLLIIIVSAILIRRRRK